MLFVPSPLIIPQIRNFLPRNGSSFLPCNCSPDPGVVPESSCTAPESRIVIIDDALKNHWEYAHWKMGKFVVRLEKERKFYNARRRILEDGLAKMSTFARKIFSARNFVHFSSVRLRNWKRENLENLSVASFRGDSRDDRIVELKKNGWTPVVKRFNWKLSHGGQ